MSESTPSDDFERFEQSQPPPRSNGTSFAEQIRQVVTDLQQLIRSEIRLAKAELREEATTAARGAGMLAAGGLLALYAVGFLLLTAVYALAGPLADWLAALIVGVVVAIVAGVLAMVGRSRLKQASPRPEQTMESVKEDVEWAKRQVR